MPSFLTPCRFDPLFRREDQTHDFGAALTTDVDWTSERPEMLQNKYFGPKQLYIFFTSSADIIT